MHPFTALLAFVPIGLSDQGRPVVQSLNAVTLQGVTIPAGFCTDWASIPRLAEVCDPDLEVFGRSCLAAYLHDYLCAIGYDKAKRSALFKAQMLADCVSPESAEIMYLAVLNWPGAETETLERLRPIPNDVRTALLAALSQAGPLPEQNRRSSDAAAQRLA